MKMINQTQDAMNNFTRPSAAYGSVGAF